MNAIVYKSLTSSRLADRDLTYSNYLVNVEQLSHDILRNLQASNLSCTESLAAIEAQVYKAIFSLQVVSYGFMPQLSRQKDQDKSDRLAAIEEIIHKLLDFSQIRAMKEEFSDEQWREMWQRVKAAKACPVSIKTRLHAIAL